MEAPTLFDEPPAPAAAAARAPARLPEAPPRSPTLLAVDGNGLAHRAYHGYGRDPRRPLHGFVAMLCTLAEDSACAGVVVGFDGPADRSARRRRHAGYKAQRPPTESGIHELLAAAAALLADAGVAVVPAREWEADDVLASAASAAERAGWRCLVASSDRDSYGAVSEATTVLDFRRGVRAVERITPQRLRRKPGVRAEQYTEFAALRGDASDNLPGVPGIGPRRAAALLRLYDTVDDAVADPIGCRSVLGGDIADALIADLDAGADSAFLRNLELMTLRRHLDVDVEACRPQAPAERVAAACERAGCAGVAGRAAVALGAG